MAATQEGPTITAPETPAQFPVRASDLFRARAHSSILIRVARSAGYWGRGKTIAQAITLARYIGSQDEVYIVECDDDAYCDDIDGSLHFNARGPIYKGVIASTLKDVRITAKDRD